MNPIVAGINQTIGMAIGGGGAMLLMELGVGPWASLGYALGACALYNVVFIVVACKLVDRRFAREMAELYGDDTVKPKRTKPPYRLGP